MKQFIHKHSAILGYVIAPFLFYAPYITHSGMDYNYTGLFNSFNNPLHYLELFFACGIVGTMFSQLNTTTKNKKKWKHFNYSLWILVILTVLIPYHTKEDFLSGFHVFMGYITFIYFNYLYFLVGWYYETSRHIYYGGLLLLCILSIMHMSVTGYIEVTYTCLVSFIVTYLYRLKHK